MKKIKKFESHKKLNENLINIDDTILLVLITSYVLKGNIINNVKNNLEESKNDFIYFINKLGYNIDTLTNNKFSQLINFVEKTLKK